MTPETFRCADASDARAEPLHGTASVVRNWLLIEQPGSWGRHALVSSGIPHQVGSELRRRARAAGIRIVLIRRGVRFSSERRQCYFIRVGETDAYQSRLELDEIDELLDVDFSPLAQGGFIPSSVERPDPLFLVCTHGRHDACCAIRGNHVSRVACAEPGLEAWECSHIGGDRFAANVVCFPHGVYYGRVAPADVVGLMHAYGNGTLSLDHYRGRCCYPFAVQAAEYFVRRETATLDVAALALVRSSIEPSGVTATFALGEGLADVEVRVERSGEHRLTCRSSAAEPIPRYELVSCTIRRV